MPSVSHTNTPMNRDKPTRPRQRRAGVLIPLFSLRTQEGWGLGEIPDIAAMARWAARAGIRILQMLPVCAVNEGETSPYSACTAFAIDPAYLGLDGCEDFVAAGGRAALPDRDRRLFDDLVTAPAVRWRLLRPLKEHGMRLAFDHFHAQEWLQDSRRSRELRRFREQNRDWLEDYALFSVLHRKFSTHWKTWPRKLAERVPTALAYAALENQREILFVCWQQWQLDEQWRQARHEAAESGVALMGDLPFVVAEDSADVWKERKLFRLGMRVGAPPDEMCAEGQDWGLPLFNWQAMEESGFSWIRRRAARSGDLFDLYRLDHVIGMYRTYYRSANGHKVGFSPSEEKEQIRLGESLLSLMDEYAEVIAEDLGTVPKFLPASLARLQIPGYRVLRWEKDEVKRDGHSVRSFRDPSGWPEVSVAAPGTHDTEPLAVWYDGLSLELRRALVSLPGLEHIDCHKSFDDGIRDALMGVLYMAPSDLCLIPFQDLLGTREQVNVPGSVNDHNWTYRMPMTIDSLCGDMETTKRLFDLAARSRRWCVSGPATLEK